MNAKPSPQTVRVNAKLRLSYWLMLLSILGGAFLYGPDFGTMPIGQWVASCLVIGFFISLPLLMFILTAHRPTPGGVSWMSFLLLGYLVFGIVLIFSPNGLLAGLLLTGTTLSTFFYAVVWLRPFKKAAKASNKK
ncbi:DUF2069 domain-containing protein [Saccharospirillum salsuginis]|uniref:DUF2069 domain-containing protein n=1 Tax=Saccharospirillum salsuginis TaxID=418750 RepID=A0A918K5T3_9GAMM|nr:DUF2069 domain-containing protein [Saccharospirillum salsuginis]GGX51017.1 hypothetical protein GCM10007392_17800 [Saccharospirillum salsuginis]